MTIDGRKIAEEASEELKDKVKALRQVQGKSLRLAAVLVGDDPEFKKFVQLKEKAARKIGVEFLIYQFPKEIGTEELTKRIREISDIADGILVELPLPEHIDQSEVLDKIPVEKDVDVLSPKAQALFYEVQPLVLPPAVEAIKIVLEKHTVDPKGKKVAVFGQGALVGKPISHWLETQGAEIYRIRSKTEKPEELSRQADIIIAGVGKPGLVTGDMIKEGAVVIDFGYGKDSQGKMKGDVDPAVASKAKLFSPVPGGMGPVLIVAVLKNLIILNQL